MAQDQPFSNQKQEHADHPGMLHPQPQQQLLGEQLFASKLEPLVRLKAPSVRQSADEAIVTINSETFAGEVMLQPASQPLAAMPASNPSGPKLGLPNDLPAGMGSVPGKTRGSLVAVAVAAAAKSTGGSSCTAVDLAGGAPLPQAVTVLASDIMLKLQDNSMVPDPLISPNTQAAAVAAAAEWASRLASGLPVSGIEQLSSDAMAAVTMAAQATILQARRSGSLPVATEAEPNIDASGSSTGENWGGIGGTDSKAQLGPGRRRTVDKLELMLSPPDSLSSSLRRNGGRGERKEEQQGEGCTEVAVLQQQQARSGGNERSRLRQGSNGSGIAAASEGVECGDDDGESAAASSAGEPGSEGQHRAEGGGVQTSWDKAAVAASQMEVGECEAASDDPGPLSQSFSQSATSAAADAAKENGRGSVAPQMGRSAASGNQDRHASRSPRDRNEGGSSGPRSVVPPRGAGCAAVGSSSTNAPKGAGPAGRGIPTGRISPSAGPFTYAEVARRRSRTQIEIASTKASPKASPKQTPGASPKQSPRTHDSASSSGAGDAGREKGVGGVGGQQETPGDMLAAAGDCGQTICHDKAAAAAAPPPGVASAENEPECSGGQQQPQQQLQTTTQAELASSSVLSAPSDIGNADVTAATAARAELLAAAMQKLHSLQLKLAEKDQQQQAQQGQPQSYQQQQQQEQLQSYQQQQQQPEQQGGVIVPKLVQHFTEQISSLSSNDATSPTAIGACAPGPFSAIGSSSRSPGVGAGITSSSTSFTAPQPGTMSAADFLKDLESARGAAAGPGETPAGTLSAAPPAAAAAAGLSAPSPSACSAGGRKESLEDSKQWLTQYEKPAGVDPGASGQVETKFMLQPNALKGMWLDRNVHVKPRFSLGVRASGEKGLHKGGHAEEAGGVGEELEGGVDGDLLRCEKLSGRRSLKKVLSGVFRSVVGGGDKAGRRSPSPAGSMEGSRSSPSKTSNTSSLCPSPSKDKPEVAKQPWNKESSDFLQQQQWQQPQAEQPAHVLYTAHVSGGLSPARVQGQGVPVPLGGVVWQIGTKVMDPGRGGNSSLPHPGSTNSSMTPSQSHCITGLSVGATAVHVSAISEPASTAAAGRNIFHQADRRFAGLSSDDGSGLLLAHRGNGSTGERQYGTSSSSSTAEGSSNYNYSYSSYSTTSTPTVALQEMGCFSVSAEGSAAAARVIKGADDGSSDSCSRGGSSGGGGNTGSPPGGNYAMEALLASVQASKVAACVDGKAAARAGETVISAGGRAIGAAVAVAASPRRAWEVGGVTPMEAAAAELEAVLARAAAGKAAAAAAEVATSTVRQGGASSTVVATENPAAEAAAAASSVLEAFATTSACGSARCSSTGVLPRTCPNAGTASQPDGATPASALCSSTGASPRSGDSRNGGSCLSPELEKLVGKVVQQRQQVQLSKRIGSFSSGSTGSPGSSPRLGAAGSAAFAAADGGVGARVIPNVAFTAAQGTSSATETVQGVSGSSDEVGQQDSSDIMGAGGSALHGEEAGGASVIRKSSGAGHHNLVEAAGLGLQRIRTSSPDSCVIAAGCKDRESGTGVTGHAAGTSVVHAGIAMKDLISSSGPQEGTPQLQAHAITSLSAAAAAAKQEQLQRLQQLQAIAMLLQSRQTGSQPGSPDHSHCLPVVNQGLICIPNMSSPIAAPAPAASEIASRQAGIPHALARASTASSAVAAAVNGGAAEPPAGVVVSDVELTDAGGGGISSRSSPVSVLSSCSAHNPMISRNGSCCYSGQLEATVVRSASTPLIVMSSSSGLPAVPSAAEGVEAAVMVAAAQAQGTRGSSRACLGKDGTRTSHTSIQALWEQPQRTPSTPAIYHHSSNQSLNSAAAAAAGTAAAPGSLAMAGRAATAEHTAAATAVAVDGKRSDAGNSSSSRSASAGGGLSPAAEAIVAALAARMGSSSGGGVNSEGGSGTAVTAATAAGISDVMQLQMDAAAQVLQLLQQQAKQGGSNGGADVPAAAGARLTAGEHVAVASVSATSVEELRLSAGDQGLASCSSERAAVIAAAVVEAIAAVAAGRLSPLPQQLEVVQDGADMGSIEGGKERGWSGAVDVTESWTCPSQVAQGSQAYHGTPTAPVAAVGSSSCVQADHVAWMMAASPQQQHSGHPQNGSMYDAMAGKGSRGGSRSGGGGGAVAHVVPTLHLGLTAELSQKGSGGGLPRQGSGHLGQAKRTSSGISSGRGSYSGIYLQQSLRKGGSRAGSGAFSRGSSKGGTASVENSPLGDSAAAGGGSTSGSRRVSMQHQSKTIHAPSSAASSAASTGEPSQLINAASSAGAAAAASPKAGSSRRTTATTASITISSGSRRSTMTDSLVPAVVVSAGTAAAVAASGGGYTRYHDGHSLSSTAQTSPRGSAGGGPGCGVAAGAECTKAPGDAKNGIAEEVIAEGPPQGKLKDEADCWEHGCEQKEEEKMEPLQRSVVSAFAAPSVQQGLKGGEGSGSRSAGGGASGSGIHSLNVQQEGQLQNLQQLLLSQLQNRQQVEQQQPQTRQPGGKSTNSSIDSVVTVGSMITPPAGRKVALPSGLLAVSAPEQATAAAHAQQPTAANSRMGTGADTDAPSDTDKQGAATAPAAAGWDIAGNASASAPAGSSTAAAGSAPIRTETIRSQPLARIVAAATAAANAAAEAVVRVKMLSPRGASAEALQGADPFGLSPSGSPVVSPKGLHRVRRFGESAKAAGYPYGDEGDDVPSVVVATSVAGVPLAGGAQGLGVDAAKRSPLWCDFTLDTVAGNNEQHKVPTAAGPSSPQQLLAREGRKGAKEAEGGTKRPPWNNLWAGSTGKHNQQQPSPPRAARQRSASPPTRLSSPPRAILARTPSLSPRPVAAAVAVTAAQPEMQASSAAAQQVEQQQQPMLSPAIAKKALQRAGSFKAASSPQLHQKVMVAAPAAVAGQRRQPTPQEQQQQLSPRLEVEQQANKKQQQLGMIRDLLLARISEQGLEGSLALRNSLPGASGVTPGASAGTAAKQQNQNQQQQQLVRHPVVEELLARLRRLPEALQMQIVQQLAQVGGLGRKYAEVHPKP